MADTLFDFPYLAYRQPNLFRTELVYVDPSLSAETCLPQVNESSNSERLDLNLHRISLPPAFTQIVLAELQICITSGFSNNLMVQTEWDRHNKIKVCLRACPDYVHYITEKQIFLLRKWFEDVQGDF